MNKNETNNNHCKNCSNVNEARNSNGKSSGDKKKQEQ